MSKAVAEGHRLRLRLGQMERLDGIVRSPLDPHYMAERDLPATEIVGARTFGDCLELSGIGDLRGEQRRDGRRPAECLSEMRAQLANPTAAAAFLA